MGRLDNFDTAFIVIAQDERGGNKKHYRDPRIALLEQQQQMVILRVPEGHRLCAGGRSPTGDVIVSHYAPIGEFPKAAPSRPTEDGLAESCYTCRAESAAYWRRKAAAKLNVVMREYVPREKDEAA